MFDWTLEEAGGDAKALAERVTRLITQGEIPSFEGGVLSMSAETICIHSDTPGAPEILQAVIDALESVPVTVAPPKF